MFIFKTDYQNIIKVIKINLIILLGFIFIKLKILFLIFILYNYNNITRILIKIWLNHFKQ